MSAVVAEVKLPEPVARRGISEAQWRTLANNLFPGAASDSVLMVWDYCVARKLDPLKKPCHIVPMQVKNQSGDYIWRDVVMPGIYEYRTTATRTGLYLGHSQPVYGEIVEHLGKMVPSYCDFTVYRWNKEANMRAEYPVRVWFEECCATRKDKKTGEVYLNDRWSRAPKQMMTKCAEAAALREAFPDELGGTHTDDEMAGQMLDEIVVTSGLNPRGDTSNVDDASVKKWFGYIVDTLNMDKEEHEIADALREIDTELCKFDQLYIVILDKLAKEGVISKANYKKWLKVGLDRGETHTA